MTNHKKTALSAMSTRSFRICLIGAMSLFFLASCDTSSDDDSAGRESDAAGADAIGTDANSLDADREPPDAADTQTDGGADSTPADTRPGDDADSAEDSSTEDDFLIFNADFAAQEDWSPQIRLQSYTHPGDESDFTDEPFKFPGEFDYFRTSERWHPNEHPDKQPVAQISSFRSRVPGGKSFTVFDESYGSNGDWGADAVLTKDLGAEYSELWIETWIKFQPDWVWHDTVDGPGHGQASMKFLRCRRFTGDTTQNRYSFFGEDARSGTPIALLGLKSWTTDNGNYIRSKVDVRGYTRAADYDTDEDYYFFFDNYESKIESRVAQGGEDSLGWNDLFLDDAWHQIDFYLKMDSAPGAGDGRIEVWIDGVLETSADDIPWRRASDPENIGWNECALGGNLHNIPYAEAERFEQSYSVSDYRIYSQRPARVGD